MKKVGSCELDNEPSRFITRRVMSLLSEWLLASEELFYTELPNYAENKLFSALRFAKQ